MEGTDLLIKKASQRLTGYPHRLFIAEVTLELFEGSPRKAERHFGWGRNTIAQGILELQQDVQCVEQFQKRGRPRLEAKNPKLAEDIKSIVEPHTQADPELKSQRRYLNLSAKETLELLKTKKGYREEDLPKERTMRDILNRMNYRIKPIRKAKPLKKTAETDAIFANVQAVKAEVKNDPTILEMSVDTKATVNEGDYSRGGKARTDSEGCGEKAWDHDPPAERKWIPLGIYVITTSFLMLVFGSKQTSDFWVDGIKKWWEVSGASFPQVRQLVIYLDNGPHNSGVRTQFLKRMVELANETGLQIRLVYYPPYHSKYNPVERCWGILELKWGGCLLNCLKVILQMALRMRWKGLAPIVKRLEGKYVDGIKLSKKEMRPYEEQIVRSKTLPKYDVLIIPKVAKSG